MGATASIAMGVTSATGAYAQAQALRTQADFERAQAAANQRLIALNAKDALKKGDLAAGKIKAQASKIQGAQKVSAVSQGVESSTGSMAAIQNETIDYAEIDMMTVKNNAWREAWGYRVEAANMAGQSRLRSMGLRNEAKNTLITGGLRALAYGAQAKYYYDQDKLTQKVLGDGEVKELPASNNPDEQYEKSDRMIASEDPQEKPAKDLEKSLYGQDWRNNRNRNRTRTNPIFGNEMTDSWYVYG